MARYEDLEACFIIPAQRVKLLWKLLYRTMEFHNKFLRPRLTETPYSRKIVMLADTDYVKELYELSREYAYQANHIANNETHIWNFSIQEFRAVFDFFEKNKWVVNYNSGVAESCPFIGIQR